MNYMSIMSDLSWLDWAIIAMSVYVILESLAAICSMPQGYELFCCKFKYVLALVSSLAFIGHAIQPLEPSMQWVIFGSSGTISFFVWPRTVWRINTTLDYLFGSEL